MKRGFKDLIVWQKSMELTRQIYFLTSKLPAEEKHGLVSQMRRAAVSVPSNIAEGSKRGGVRDFKQFLRIASGSLAELETQVELLKTLPFEIKQDFNVIDNLITEVTRLLVGMVTSKKLYQNSSHD